MGDSSEGSSSAALGALDEMEDNHGGFFSRIIGALSPSDTEDEPVENTHGEMARNSSDLAPGMVNLRRLRVEDVAVPKAEIVSAPVEIRKRKLVELFRNSGLTRLPVFDGTLDTPIGLVHLKDFALNHGFNGKSTPYKLRNLLRPLLYAPPSMPIGVLLQKMQTERIHMALVIDEYGGVDGLVTIEDLIEQVVGEIEDEHDQEDVEPWQREGPGCYLVESKTPLDEFEDEIGMRLHSANPGDEEIDSLGGLVFLIAGHVPARGEVIMHPDGPEFEIVDADLRRINRLRVRLPGQMDG